MNDECTHPDEGFESLPVPNEGTFRCGLCDALGYIPKRAPGRRARRMKVRLYRCRVKGCNNPVVKRGYGTGWNLQNACVDHPIRTDLGL